MRLRALSRGGVSATRIPVFSYCGRRRPVDSRHGDAPAPFPIADRILVVEKGSILINGINEQLLAAKGHYHALYTRQFQQDREAGLFETAG